MTRRRERAGVSAPGGGDTCAEAKETSVAAATEGRMAGREVGKDDEATSRCLDFIHLQWNASEEIKAGASCALIYAFKSLLWVENGLSRSRVEVRKPLRSSELSTVLVI